MTELVITRGLPASGKTTWARQWVAEDRDNRARVNRDDLRVLLHGKATYKWPQEQAVTEAAHAAVRALLTAGKSVVVDDTNLRVKYVRAYMELGMDAGAKVRVQDFNTDLETCVERDSEREFLHGTPGVGADVIQGMAGKFLRKGELPPIPAVEATPARRYYPSPDLPAAVMVDLDGTLALHAGRSPYDYTRVLEDMLNLDVATVVHALAATRQVVYCSGRPEMARCDTGLWLKSHNMPSGPLFMRADGDDRNDAVVKRELFDAHIRDAYNVLCVLDDRNRVVRMWRELGLTVLQVAEGNF